jgi:hypothetical protein
MMATSLESILNKSEASEPAPAPEPVPEQSPAPTGEAAPQTELTTDGQPRDDKGRFAPKSDKPETTPAAPPAATQEARTVPIDSLLDERRKRQELEKELQAIRAKPPEQPKAPDFFEDPNKYREYVERTVEDRLLNERLNMSEMIVRQAFPDAEEAIAAFMEAAQANPAVVTQALSQPHPYKVVYDEGKRMLAMKQIGDPLTYEQRVREKLLSDEKFLEEMRAKFGAAPPAAQTTPAATTALPPSLATARNAGTRSGPAYAGPQPLSAILNR